MEDVVLIAMMGLFAPHGDGIELRVIHGTDGRPFTLTYDPENPDASILHRS